MAKQKKADALDKRLKVYAAAAAGTLAFAPPANAMIHHTQPLTPLVVDKNTPTQEVSMENNVLHKEFRFLYGAGPSSSYPSCIFHGVHVGSGGGGKLIGLGGIANLPEGFNISSNALNGFRTYMRLPALNNSLTCGSGPGPCNGNFCKAGYLGVRFKLNPNPNEPFLYGWIHYEGAGGTAGTITEWAYEDSGGPIRAGQRFSAPVPTFTELGFYLFAAMLLLGGILMKRPEADES
jgi:hypothetical protein